LRSNHKSPEMIDVIHNLCQADDCILLAYFGIKDGPSQYCSKHKSPEMIDVLHKRCIELGCTSIPSFGINGGPIQYCSKHRPINTIDIKHKRCLYPECKLSRSFGIVGEHAQYCFQHRLDGMINVVSKRCLIPECMTVPSFGIKGHSPQYCKQHKLSGMIYLKDRGCVDPTCMIRPCFGFKDGNMEHCNLHKLEGMVNIRNMKCLFSECIVQARFGFLNEKVQYCSEHKLDGMVNIEDKRCEFSDCEHISSFVLLFSTSRKHCAKHASLNEYTYTRRNPVCNELKCFNQVVFVEPKDINVYPVRCREHKIPTDIELVQRICPNCEEFIHYPIDQEYCMNCGKYREWVIYSTREMSVKYILNASNIEFIHDQKISRHGSRCRPDFLIVSNFGYIIVEVDENQHNKHFQHDENNRMKMIYQDIQYISPRISKIFPVERTLSSLPRKQVLFIRYNPDKYDSDVIMVEKLRLEYLLTVITHMKQISSLGIPLGYVKLFYDGFTGHPAIQPLDTDID
jgi:hypothetical protein